MSQLEQLGYNFNTGVYPDFLAQGVLFVTGSTLVKLNALIFDKLSSLTLDCFGGSFSIHSKAEVDYLELYVAVYLESIYPDQYLTPETVENILLSTVISSIAVFYFFSDFTIEIYNVCTKKEFQKGGRSSKIFQILDLLMQVSNFKTAQLGVDYNNVIFATVVRTYLKLGFVYNVGANDRSRHLTFLQYYLFMEKVSGQYADNLDEIYSDALISRYQLFESHQCLYSVYIPGEDFKSISRNYLREDVEYVGSFQAVENIIIDGVPTQLLRLSPEVFKGVEEFAPIINEKFTFHTHPIACYVKYNCLAGWPSNYDFAGIVTVYSKQQSPVMMICSIEGAYIVYLAVPMQIIISMTLTDTDFLNDLNELILVYFQSANSYRDTLEFLDFVVAEISTLTFSKLIQQTITAYGEQHTMLLERITGKIDKYGLQFIYASKILELFLKPILELQKNGLYLNFFGLNNNKVCQF